MAVTKVWDLAEAICSWHRSCAMGRHPRCGCDAESWEYISVSSLFVTYRFTPKSILFALATVKTIIHKTESLIHRVFSMKKWRQWTAGTEHTFCRLPDHEEGSLPWDSTTCQVKKQSERKADGGNGWRLEPEPQQRAAFPPTLTNSLGCSVSHF